MGKRFIFKNPVTFGQFKIWFKVSDKPNPTYIFPEKGKTREIKKNKNERLGPILHKRDYKKSGSHV